MGHYRARDLFLLPNLVSLSRLPLAILFTRVVDQHSLALLVLALAGMSDVLDGYLARRLNQATATGAVVDGVLDKGFSAVVIVTLLIEQRLSPLQALLLGTREIGEAPLVAWWMLHHEKRRARAEDPRANWLGKLVTVMQFACIALVLARNPLSEPMFFVCGAAGIVAAVLYFHRELADEKA